MLKQIFKKNYDIFTLQSHDIGSSPAKTIERSFITHSATSMCHRTTKPSKHPIFFSLCSNRRLVMKQTELVFIPSPGIGHLVATVEIAKLMTHRDRRLSITILIMKFPFGSNDSMTSDSDSIRFLTLPPVEVSPGTTGITEFLKPQIPLVRDAVHEITRSNSVRLGGFVIDMFCTSMIDVADEFEVPSYLFFTSSAAFLGFMFHLQFLHDNEGLDFNEFKDSDAELEVPSYANPVPGKVFPSLMFGKEAILAHSAVGGFVSHCGWNSTLESIFYGVPVATWPMFAEQRINAFQMVKDLGLAVKIKMNYNKDISYVVSAREIEIGLKNLMNIDNEVRKKREEMKKISRKVMIEGGSSHFSLGHFIEDMMANIPYTFYNFHSNNGKF
ncbi:unnamed protein product, partial [Vitis vinifera]